MKSSLFDSGCVFIIVTFNILVGEGLCWYWCRCLIDTLLIFSPKSGGGGKSICLPPLLKVWGSPLTPCSFGTVYVPYSINKLHSRVIKYAFIA